MSDVRDKAQVHSGVRVAPVWSQSGSETLTMPCAFHIVPSLTAGSLTTHLRNILEEQD